MKAVTGPAADVKWGGADRSDTTTDWLTPPPSLKSKIYETWNLDFDPCPYPRPEWNGLLVAWKGRAFVNPPYGRETYVWVRKALAEIAAGHIEIAVFLIHVRTDTAGFHEFVLGGAQELVFVEGRIAFIPTNGTDPHAPSFGSMLVVYERDSQSSRCLLSSWPKHGRRT